MIPSIETILSDLMNSRITFKQALELINTHIELARENADLRDHFAAKAIQGSFNPPIPASQGEKEYIAMHAYKMADAMLKARVQ